MNMFDFMHSFADGQKGNAFVDMKNQMGGLMHPQQAPQANAMNIPMGTLVEQMQPQQAPEMMQAPAIPQPPNGGLAKRVAKLFMGGM